jgi:hypothetical protein
MSESAPSIWVEENTRNARNSELYAAIIREVDGVDQVGVVKDGRRSGDLMVRPNYGCNGFEF